MQHKKEGWSKCGARNAGEAASIFITLCLRHYRNPCILQAISHVLVSSWARVQLPKLFIKRTPSICRRGFESQRKVGGVNKNRVRVLDQQLDLQAVSWEGSHAFILLTFGDSDLNVILGFSKSAWESCWNNECTCRFVDCSPKLYHNLSEMTCEKRTTALVIRFSK